MKHSFFQAAVVSILLYGCTTWMLTKRLEKKLNGNYTRMLRAVLNKSWRQHSTRHQLYRHLPPIKKTIQIRRTRHAGHCWRSKDELISDVLLWTPTYGRAKQDDPLELTYSNYVRTQDVTLKTCRMRWRIGRSGERGSGISVLAARHDDDDDDVIVVSYLFGFKGTSLLEDILACSNILWARNIVSKCVEQGKINRRGKFRYPILHWIQWVFNEGWSLCRGCLKI